MADASSFSPSRSSSTTPTLENMHSSQAAQASHAPDMTNGSTTSFLPTLETLVDCQALFDSSTKKWVPVPRGLILLPAVEDTNAYTVTGDTHIGDPSTEQGNSSGGLHTEEHLVDPSNHDGNTGNIEQPGNTLHNDQPPLNFIPGTWLQYLQEAREALDRMESSFNAPLGYDEQGNAIGWDPINDPLPDWNPIYGIMPNDPIMPNATGLTDGTLHHDAPQTLTGNSALVIEVILSEHPDANAPHANGHAHDDEDADGDTDGDPEDEEDGEGQAGVNLNH